MGRFFFTYNNENKSNAVREFKRKKTEMIWISLPGLLLPIFFVSFAVFFSDLSVQPSSKVEKR